MRREPVVHTTVTSRWYSYMDETVPLLHIGIHHFNISSLLDYRTLRLDGQLNILLDLYRTMKIKKKENFTENIQ